jgi:putative CocE/NonD family hydrolase
MAVPARQHPAPIREFDNVRVPLSDGAELSARLWLPPEAEVRPVPAVVEVSPYRHEDHTRRRDAIRHPYFAERGYASLRIDVRGSGASDGVLVDEYTEREQQDVCEALAWVASQPWSTGSAGMIGLSWGGFAALQAAARRPPELKAIVVLCASADRYGADVKFRGGALLGCELLPWSSTMLAMSVRPPDPALVGEGWRDLWLERLENVKAFAETWVAHQRFDDYWRNGSPCIDYSGIGCPVFAVGGWADPYRQAVLDLLEQLPGPRKGLIGPWAHRYPEEGNPGPAIDFRAECVRWWDQWLKGEDTGVMEEPDLRAWMEESIPGRKHVAGRWVAEAAWPRSPTRIHSLSLGQRTLRPSSEGRRRLMIRGAERSGYAAGCWCPWGSDDLPADQRGEDELALTFTSELLSERLEILGLPLVWLEVSADRPRALVAVRLCDVSPEGDSHLVARGLLNLCHRSGSEIPHALQPGRRYTVRVPLDAAAHAFRPGHRVRLALSPTYWPWAWPSPEPVTCSVYVGGPTRLELPIRVPNELDGRIEFPPPPQTNGGYGQSTSAAQYEPDAGSWVMVVDRDRGRRQVREDGLEVDGRQRDVFTLADGDPLSATVECDREMGLTRGAWATAVRTRSTMTCDARDFRMVNRIEAFENGKLIFSREQLFEVPRDLI